MYKREDKIVYFVVIVLFKEFAYRFDCSISHHCLIVGTERFKVGKDSSVLASQGGPDVGIFLSNSEYNLVVLFLDEG